MENKITELIDIEKFQGKLEELEKKENKKVFEGVLENLCQSDKIISRIDNERRNTI